MNLLPDTHTFLWALNGGPLSDAARQAFLNLENTLFLSAASYWEICIKISIGKLVLTGDWSRQFDAEIAANGIRWLPIEQTHCRRILVLPPLHQDPIDRLLVAQVLCERLTILTADRNIPEYPIETLW